MGIQDMIPASPKVPSVLLNVHQSKMVAMVTALMYICLMVNASLIGLNGLILTSLTSNVKINSSQIKTVPMMETGKATANQLPQPGFGDMASMAMTFCGEAIGEAIPAILEAKAIPKIRALANAEWEGIVFKTGCTKE